MLNAITWIWRFNFGMDWLMALLRTMIVFLLAWVLGTVLISITSTHIILHGLIEVGATIPLDVRLDTVLRDLAGFGPTLGAITLIGFLIAFLFAAWVIRNFIPAPRIGYTLAGFTSIIVMMFAVYWFYYFDGMGAIHPVPAARTLPGLLSLAMGGAVAGFFFANFHRARS